MPFDPSLPAPNSKIRSAELRNQFNALKAISDGLLASLTQLQAQLDDLGEQIANLPAGPKGDQGEKGDKGDTGDQGPPFSQAVIDQVNTTPPGSAASVGVNFDGTSVHFTFEIPRGDKGDQGDPGQVTEQQLNDAIAGTSNNTNGVGLIDTSGMSDPDAIAVADKLNELILNGRK